MGLSPGFDPRVRLAPLARERPHLVAPAGNPSFRPHTPSLPVFPYCRPYSSLQILVDGLISRKLPSGEGTGTFRQGETTMNPACDPISEAQEPAPSTPTPARRLPSGRSVVMRAVQGQEELEIRTAEGELEVRVTLTEAGPVIQLRGARLEVESPDAVLFHCRRFEVHAAERLDLQSGGDAGIMARELRVKTEGDVRIDGEVIRLNCEQSGSAVGEEPAHS